MEMTTEMSALLRALGVYAESHTTTADLRIIALTWHAAFAISNRGAGDERVGAEALSTVLSTSHAVALAFTISNTVGIGNFAVANVCQLDASHNTVLGISEAALVRPAWRDNGSGSWGRTTGGDGSILYSALSDIAGNQGVATATNGS